MDIRTLQYWHKLEHFNPYSLQEQHNENIKTFSILRAELFPNFRDPVIKPGKVIRYYNVYFGIFKIDGALKALEKGMGKKMRFRDTGDDESCFCSFSLDTQGIFNPDSFRVSSFPWAIHRVRDGKIVMDEWDQAFHSFETSMFLYLKDNNETMTYDFLLKARNYFASYLNWELDFSDVWLRIDMVIGDKQDPEENKAIADGAGDEIVEQAEPDTQADDEETDAQIKQNDLFNSFFVRDLERIIADVSKNESVCGESFRNFLEHGARNRIDIEHSPDVLLELMAPRNLPKGRWPSDYGSRFMQQVNVNAFLADTIYEQPLFSVNGPPGTGKTTLLKDIIAAIVVNRANAMCNLATPDDAFAEEICQIETKTNKGLYINHVFELKPEIRRYGILVTSNNNGAVENITHSLPSIVEIPKEYNLEEYQYFSEVSDLLFGEGKTWALNAAALGNRKNCTRFVESFWPLNKDSKDAVRYDLNKMLRERIKKISKQDWDRSKARFQAALVEFDKEYVQIESIYKHVLKYRQLQVDLQDVDKEIGKVKTSENAISEQLTFQKQELERLQQEIGRCRTSLEEMRKSDPLLIIKSLFWRSRWCNTYRDLQRQLQSCVMHQQKQNKVVIEIEQAKQILKINIESLGQKRVNLESELAVEREKLEQFRAKTSSHFRVDEYFFGNANEELSKTSPWGYSDLNRLRETLFLEALQLHKAFVENSKLLRDNLDAFAKLMRRQIPAIKAKTAASALLQSFFLIVPVVSTTFASVGSFLKDIPPEDIGYLFIDEAGQAMPQSAAGAIWRAKKVIAVGDPLQIEPVVTLHDSVIDALGRYYSQDIIITDKFTSVQSLSDLANRLGGFRTLEEPDDLWIGAPLIVHNRCQPKVFKISNEIAYNNKMIYASKKRDYAECTWLHVCGNSRNGHYVPEQTKEILPIIKKCFKEYADKNDPSQKYPSLFLISPFRSVRAGLATFFRNNLYGELEQMGIAVNTHVVRAWISNCIGTIHTFQGKQADTVVLCLGVDSGGKGEGAVQWACQRPNILNVAVTRAQGNLYIVGDRSVWGNRDYFETALTYCT
ncbi:hypothetical protein Desaci_1980 [Desulfosporosinus acidiphilus SJ4]|uniref:DNA2/NAM7 helicase-like C-terminal domain-containing protein n=1 Tax=Desulfosporosinus acidiphilus (strain DSM 22704 / JCM 16185 / SJ4) TaxID=646529 RepID=I4D582_DESAJ|nr:AAA domain-containing protein [Desulfosporosinus acidiphilus]AFM40956.1 hypothetical protein Desaci_1980 [Desulfosporosinus acidiphilus SJ4]